MFQKSRPKTPRPLFQPPKEGTRHNLFQKHRGDVHFGNVLKAAYGDERSMERLKQKGYQLDTNLSNHNQSVYIRPQDKKMIFTVAGTHNLDDVQTDLIYGIGGSSGLKHTKRYEEAANTLERAKAKYHDYSVNIAGHSLGGVLAADISKPSDVLGTHSRAATFLSKVKSNETAIRHQGDWVSMLATGTKTIDGGSGSWWDPIGAHDISNMRGTGVWF